MDERDPAYPPIEVGQLAWFDVEPVEDATVLHIHGEIDLLTAHNMRQQITELIEQGPRVAVLDLAAVSFFASSGLAVLIEAREAATRHGVTLRLAAPSRSARRPLQITGLAGRFDIRTDVASALD